MVDVHEPSGRCGEPYRRRLAEARRERLWVRVSRQETLLHSQDLLQPIERYRSARIVVHESHARRGAEAGDNLAVTIMEGQAAPPGVVSRSVSPSLFTFFAVPHLSAPRTAFLPFHRHSPSYRSVAGV